MTAGAVQPEHVAAQRRVEETMGRAQHVQLTSLIVGRATQDVRRARDAATDAAIMHDRRTLLEDARRVATTWVLQAFADRGYSGTWAATEQGVSVARSNDRTAVAEALADAVTADVVEDLVDAETIDTLRSTWALLAQAAAIPEPGALSGLTASLTQSRTRPGWTRLGAAGIVFLIGLLYVVGGRPLGLVLILAAAVVLTNALRGRPS